ncbi:GNAT family N-acetyltransferase [Rheinheimera maricola]|uniref:GNAT family N-acetyltransferase n=1 Tax=Rheinheimera maricola TaxID=2793282 RepID=A0ABS7XB08_9GAMM|nr:GNAT family N-acetyltransferase [Rheinheimera maricola]MBZ9612516.1 GNAT family N-acetyltransferase [Rheinheimera maricola]
MTTTPTETEVTTWFLQFEGAAKSDISWPDGVQLVEAKIACPELSQFMFRAVGARWQWFSRLSWNYQQWFDYLTTQQVRTWLLWVQGTPAGYIELLKHTDQSVEIKFFGLLPQFIGQRLGQPLAEAAVTLAAQWQASRIWLHSCSADHPSALKNYQQAGFVITDIQHSTEALPLLNDNRLLAEEFVYSALTYHIERAG